MKFLITSGPTREYIDPVRYLSNRSSGKMGYHLAQEAANRSYDVTLISGPTYIDSPKNVKSLIYTNTADEMFEAVSNNIKNVDIAIFCAAVADYTIKEPSSFKIKKKENTLNLTLTKTRDILSSARSDFKFEGFLVGFAAETNDLYKNAKNKLNSKKCDLLVGNNVLSKEFGFDSNYNKVTLFFKNGETKEIIKKPKVDIAKDIISIIENLLKK